MTSLEQVGPFVQDEGRLHYGDEAAVFAASRELAPVEVIARFTVDGEPTSKSRARFTKRGSKTVVYTPERTKVAEQAVAWKFRQSAPSHAVDAVHEFGIVGLFFYSHRQRRDVDNMIKLLCDGLNGVAWDDDNQVREVTGRKSRVLSPEEARTEVLVYRLAPIDKPTAPCQQCGKRMDLYRSTKATRKFCSQKCHLESRRATRLRECRQCGKEFDGESPGVRGRVFCSAACQEADRKENHNVTSLCAECGSTFSRPKSWSGKVGLCSDECRALAAQRDAEVCKRGHLRSEFGHIRKSGVRYCRECNRILAAERKAAQTITNPEGDPA